MKKTYKYSLTLLAAMAAAVSCRKADMAQNHVSEEESCITTINAVAPVVGAPVSKVKMAQSYAVLWQKNDEIYVTDGTNYNTFTLESGEGTPQGTFKQETSVKTFSGTVQAYYPASLVSGEKLVWPAVQTADLTVPMYCKNNLISTESLIFPFSSLGSILQLVFSTSDPDIILKSIEVTADKAMSGPFTVVDGKAVISDSELTPKPGIILNAGEGGVKLGMVAKYFNIAIPAGTYRNLTISFITDKLICIKHSTEDLMIDDNTVRKLSLTGNFGPMPAGSVESMTVNTQSW